MPKGKDTGFKIYNCVAKGKVPLILPSAYATFYTCGPTVYDSTHLGHASCYVKLDIIQRTLKSCGNINLITAMNITDIDDKIINRALKEGTSWQNIAQKYEKEFWQDMQNLGVEKPLFILRVSEQMPEIINFINKLVEKERAYKSKDGSVYFEVAKQQNYGKLQKVILAENKTGDSGKHLDADFALWKSQKSIEEPAWPSAWSSGRPGWHIECSAMASKLFGNQIDFHAGGLDLRFPHHENEEAQSCAFHSTPQWVNYWIHAGQLNIKGQNIKMSKSLGNIVSIPEMLQQYKADVFRMACALSNYKNSMEYADDLMETAKNTLNKFKSFQNDCQAYYKGLKPAANQLLQESEMLESLNAAKVNFKQCIEDDFNTAGAIIVLIELIAGISKGLNGCNMNSNLISSNCYATVAAVDSFVQQQLLNMGFDSNKQHNNLNIAARDEQFKQLIDDLLIVRANVRNSAVSSKNKSLFAICDELRDCLKRHGIDIKDHAQGSSWNFRD